MWLNTQSIGMNVPSNKPGYTLLKHRHRRDANGNPVFKHILDGLVQHTHGSEWDVYVHIEPPVEVKKYVAPIVEETPVDVVAPVIEETTAKTNEQVGNKKPGRPKK